MKTRGVICDAGTVCGTVLACDRTTTPVMPLKAQR
jgi:hypothetical protein